METLAEPARLLSDRRLVVFDLDGTLYDQRRLRRALALQLLSRAARGRGMRELRCILRFRRLREEMAGAEAADLDGVLYARLAAETGRPAAELRALIEEWMCRRPLPLLRVCRAPGITRLFEVLGRRGSRVAIWSDYPVREKLAALELSADFMVCAEDPGVGALKPNPAGLAALLDRCGCAPHEALMIGDRAERDGAAAGRLGVPFLLYGRKSVGGAVYSPDFSALADALET